MRQHLLALLLVAPLILGTISCSKKDAPAPPAPTTGSYKIGGQLKACQVATSLTTVSGHDYLALVFTTTPEPSYGSEQLYLLFAKETSQPATTYEPRQFRLAVSGTTTILYSATTFTVSSTGSGLSGTFTSVSPYTNLIGSDLTEGVFANVPL